jgi:hypothetical protein
LFVCLFVCLFVTSKPTNIMKKVFLILVAVALLDNAAHSQTPAEHHNLMLKALFTKYPNGNFSASTAYDEFKLYAQANGLPVPTMTYSALKAEYFTNVTSETDFVNRLVSKGHITQALADYTVSVLTSLKNNKLGDNYMATSLFLSQISATKQGSLYSGLSSTEKTLADNFLDQLGKSYELWWEVDNTQVPNFAKTKGTVASRRCGWACAICVAFFDAVGVFIGYTLGANPYGQIVVGAFASFVARCCICSSCSDNVNCSGQ